MKLQLKNKHIFFALGDIWEVLDYKLKFQINELVTKDSDLETVQEVEFTRSDLELVIGSVNNNRIISEQYWDDYGPQSLSNSFSMSKSIVSLLVGCAISDGFIESVDQPVSDFLPAWTSFDGKTLTIKDLLTMSAGVKWDESHSSLFSKATEAYYGKELWKLTQTEVLEARPGEHFNYQSGVTQILAFLLQKATGKSVSEYASEKIWTPINAEEVAHIS